MARSKKKKKGFLAALRRLFWTAVLLGLVFILGFYASIRLGWFGPLPTAEELKNLSGANASIIYSTDGVQLGKIFKINRNAVDFEDLPTHLVEALIATEDARFYQHDGIDYRSLGRVLVKNIIMGDRDAGGGSTITQQLAKNLFGRSDHAALSIPVAKVKEMILAKRLERLYSKEEILTFYFNTVSFSENTVGIVAGTQRFFSKKPSQLQTEESAVLVGLLKANTYYNPRLNPEAALGRRNVVLQQMARYHYLTPERSEELQALPLKLDYQNLIQAAKAPYFVAQVKKEVRRLIEEIEAVQGLSIDPSTDGLQIKTTLHWRWQEAAEKNYREHLESAQQAFEKDWQKLQRQSTVQALVQKGLEKSVGYLSRKRNGWNSQALNAWSDSLRSMEVWQPDGMTVVEMSARDSVAHYLKLLRAGLVGLSPQDGALRVWVGGRHWQTMPFDNVLAKRQAASTFKPLVYAAALENGIEPCDYWSAAQEEYADYDQYRAENYDQEYTGYYSMTGALKRSVNTVAVKALWEVGMAEVSDLARRLGLAGDLPNSPVMALGAGSVTTLELAVAYAAFANGGFKVEPYMIEEIRSRDGKLLYSREEADLERVLPEDNAALMNAMLQKVVDSGTARSLRSRYGLRGNWAGKTGTAQQYRDARFLAYQPEMVLSAWVGGESPLLHFSSGRWGSGSTLALPLAGGLLRRAEGAGFPWATADFSALTPALKDQLDCPDYREENLIDRVKNFFDKELKKVLPDERADSTEEGPWWKRIFKGKKDRS